MMKPRTSMRKLREVYRLKFEFNYSNRTIGHSVSLSPGTVSDYITLFKVSGLTWDEAKQLNDIDLEKRIYGVGKTEPCSERPKPDWQQIYLEMQRKGVTLQLLWHEHKKLHPNGLGYTQFSKRYNEFCATAEPVMRFTHKAGEKIFVDYSGLKMEWIDRGTGEIYKAEIFVGCLGASHLIYAEATASQSLPDWISSHIRMFEAFGGVSEMLVPDNLKSGVIKAHRYDPDINITYAALAEHYGIAVVPTRIVSPRDKAKVENAVLCVEREIIAALRHQRFFSLLEINQAIAVLLKKLNHRPMQRIELSRQQLFEQIEKSELKLLPTHRFELQDWKKAKVHIDYHICVNKHFYSVPYQWIGKHVDVCLTPSRIEVFYQSQRIALHRRDNRPTRFTTLEEHMPPGHRHYQQEQNDASVQYLMDWADTVGISTAECVAKFFETRAFPQQAIRVVLGLKRLAKQFGNPAFEAACKQTLILGRYRFNVIESILKHGIKRTQLIKTVTTKSIHCRGAEYYQ